jgi:hypothetical protein
VLDPVNPVRLFFPADEGIKRSSQPHTKRNLSPGRLLAKSSARAKKKLDLAGIDLAIQDDTERQVILVLKQYHGKIIIVDPGTLKVRDAFWVANGEPISGIAITDGLAVLLVKPDWWPEVAALKHGEHDESMVCALFPPDFSDALGSAIQKKAVELGVANIRRATISFAVGQQSGVIVRHVN